MAIQIKQRITRAEFEAFIAQPENADSTFELVAGEVFEVVSNNYSSMIAARILTFIGMYLLQQNIGYVTGSDGGYIVQGESYIPDVGFISKTRQPEPNHDAYNPQAPDLAVEVMSPTDSEKKLLLKVSNYLAAGTVVWVVYPEECEVHIHRPEKGANTLDMNGTISGEPVLPGFTLAVKDIFPEDSANDDDKESTD